MKSYSVKSPIKYAGSVRRAGTVELPEAVGDALVASGHVVENLESVVDSLVAAALSGNAPSDKGYVTTSAPNTAQASSESVAVVAPVEPAASNPETTPAESGRSEDGAAVKVPTAASVTPTPKATPAGKKPPGKAPAKTAKPKVAK